MTVAKPTPKLTPRIVERIQKAGLPTTGSFPFTPKIRSNRRGQPDLVTAFPTKGPKKDEKGFVDADGNIWIRDSAHAGYPEHWDVKRTMGTITNESVTTGKL